VVVRVYLIGSKVTDSVVYGFLPAAARMGLDLTIVTDQPEAHQRAIAAARDARRPGAIGAQANPGQPTVIGGDPWDVRALIPRLAALPRADAVLTNSDHLQVQTALAADYLGLPGKDWRAALRAKDKVLMRRRLAAAGAEHVAAAEVTPDLITARSGPPPVPPPVPPPPQLSDLTYPAVLKPATGVASEDVVLVSSPAELAEHAEDIARRRPGERLIAEEYLPGQLHTMETLGDGSSTWVLGGFRTDVSAPPFFIEERLTWDPPPPEAEKHVLNALSDLGVSFGPGHTEFVLGEATRLIEVNDRLIGDHCDFLLSDLLGVDLFELTLHTYLGEPLPASPPPARGHAVTECAVADRSGILHAAPDPGPQPQAEPGTSLTYWPLRAIGDRVDVTHTNRDYLGVICALGPDPAAVERSIRAFRAAAPWDIAP
jgi:biotin carboxylase